jgi:hypothetical protein
VVSCTVKARQAGSSSCPLSTRTAASPLANPTYCCHRHRRCQTIAFSLQSAATATSNSVFVWPTLPWRDIVYVTPIGCNPITRYLTPRCRYTRFARPIPSAPRVTALREILLIPSPRATRCEIRRGRELRRSVTPCSSGWLPRTIPLSVVFGAPC